MSPIRLGQLGVDGDRAPVPARDPGEGPGGVVGFGVVSEASSRLPIR